MSADTRRANEAVAFELANDSKPEEIPRIDSRPIAACADGSLYNRKFDLFLLKPTHPMRGPQWSRTLNGFPNCRKRINEDRHAFETSSGKVLAIAAESLLAP